MNAWIVGILMARNRAADMRTQVIKMVVLTSLMALSLLGLIHTLEGQAWLLSVLFALTFAQSVVLLNTSTEGYLFLKRLKAGG